MKLKFAITYFTLLSLIACKRNTVEVKNEKQGQLEASVRLEITGVKKFGLDEHTAPRPEYTQLYRGLDEILYFTFFNNFNNSIYFYDYNLNKFIKKIIWEDKKSKDMSGLIAYHIKSLDSIYLFNMRTTEIMLANEKGDIINKTSLRDNMVDSKWLLRYPQYYPRTVTPFIETAHELLLTGFFSGSIPESIISDFKFTARLDLKTNSLRFSNKYPHQLYGFNYNWDGGLFTEVYSDLHSDGNKLVLSFPVSHDLYIADLNKNEYKKVYGGSNFAGTIISSNKPLRKSSREEILSNIIGQDEYTAIKYDKFRKVYYRFLFKRKTESDQKNDWKEKPVAVIVMDNKFRYLGETVIGTGEEWNWQNSFVTKEGLNIEYTGTKNDENFLTLKVFTPKKI